jgi:serine/threonine protein kinase/tetratricopeptide (TPR) repeat protein
MTPERWHQVCTIFAAAVRCGSAERAVLLDEACANDQDLRAEVDRLLADDSAASGDRFLTVPTPAAELATPRPITEGPGSAIGPYKLLERLGEGGMGIVYLAEQETPVRRKVALKIIKPGMDTALVIARFEAERQALALMDHPHIAKVFDAGTTGQVEGGGWRVEGREENEASSPSTRHAPRATPSGRPYFAMELVRGVPITEYCDTNRLEPRERLRLILPICQAIQHAHQKGIIHRDIKPSNLLVTLVDGQPAAKVIDFGVAKAIDHRLIEETIFTQFGQIVGTLEYMSPEQAGIGPLDVDTRTDIYALGVVLYELLAGSTPLGRASLREAGYGEILRRIREEETPKPSTRLSESDAALATISAQRKTEPARLAKLLRGELDWIVMKALEKDRTRRYDAAAAFGRDIERYLEGDAVEAGPPSATYRLRKFARKHRAALGTAAAFAVLIVLGAATASFLAVQARRAEAATRKERDRAIAAEAVAMANLVMAQEQEKKAKKSESDAKAVLEFFQNNVLAAARPKALDGGLGIDATISEAVEAAEPRINEAFTNQPAVEAALRDALGTSYHHLGKPARAVRQHERALELRRLAFGPDHPAALSSMNNLAVAYERVGRLEEAISLQEEALNREKATLGPDHDDTLTSMVNLAVAYDSAGRTLEAIPLHEEAFKRRKSKLGPNHPDTLTAMDAVGVAYEHAGLFSKAIAAHAEALNRLKAALGPDHPGTLTSMDNLAVALGRAGRPSEAIPLLEETLKRKKAILGPDNPAVLGAMNNLAMAWAAAGRFADALPLLEETLKRKKAALGVDHPDTLVTMNNLAAAYGFFGRLSEATALSEEVLKGRKSALGPDHPSTLNSMSNLAAAYSDSGRLSEAISLQQDALKREKAKLGPDHPRTLETMNDLAVAYERSGRLAEAVTIHEETLKQKKAKLGLDHPATLATMNNLAVAIAKAGRLSEALPLFEETLTRHETKLGPDNPLTLATMNSLVRAYLESRRWTEAETLARKCLDLRSKNQKQADSWWTFETKSELGAALAGQKKYAEAEPLLLAGHEGLRARQATIPLYDRKSVAQAAARIVPFYEAWGKKDKAAEWRARLIEEGGSNTATK